MSLETWGPFDTCLSYRFPKVPAKSLCLGINGSLMFFPTILSHGYIFPQSRRYIHNILPPTLLSQTICPSKKSSKCVLVFSSGKQMYKRFYSIGSLHVNPSKTGCDWNLDFQIFGLNRFLLVSYICFQKDFAKKKSVWAWRFFKLWEFVKKRKIKYLCLKNSRQIKN